MPKLVIDGVELEIPEGITLIQACELAGKEIPHFCFHERLNIAGNCRMCLVEVEKSPKPVASCAMPATDGMIVHTNTEKVRKAREGVMELLLINHPLDCPVCDQGGECDLQEQAFKYGRGTSRFDQDKRAVIEKNMGSLIKTNMTRCIHCTRCIRFATEVAGVEEIGALYRGENMQVTSYLGKMLTSELSGNIIDLCPVGALTSKPYAFKARSWELTKTESIDVHDALGSNIRIDSRGLEVMRILPKLHEGINEEWLSDKARFSYDGLKNSRIDRAYIRNNGKFVEVPLEEALKAAAQRLQIAYANDKSGSRIAAIAGYFATVESMFLLKKLLQNFNCTKFSANQHDYKFDITKRGNYLFNTTIEGIDQADICLLIGANPRHAAPVLNARIGRMQRNGQLAVYRIGDADDQTYSINELGNDPLLISQIATGQHEISKILTQAKNPMVIIGDGVYSRKDGQALLSSIYEIIENYNIVRDNWNGFNILHNHASMVGGLDIGFVSENNEANTNAILQQAKAGKIELVYLLGSDEIDISMLGSAFVIYQGHHGDIGASRADIILPSPAYTEQDGLYVNMEGRVQAARAAVQPLLHAKEDWIIINSIARILGVGTNASNLEDIRKQIATEYPIFANLDNLEHNECSKILTGKVKLTNSSINKVYTNYYMTDSISRASVTMGKCIKTLSLSKNNRE